jgi:hypothetical protein
LKNNELARELTSKESTSNVGLLCFVTELNPHIVTDGLASFVLEIVRQRPINSLLEVINEATKEGRAYSMV